MPSRNIYKDYIANTFYHVYNRGVNRQKIFRDERDYRKFLDLLKRYLGAEKINNTVGEEYPSFCERMELLAYCLMPNHFHFLIYQNDEYAMKDLMKSLCVSYGMYFNKRYKRVGPLFQQRYKASRVSSESYLLHISRYIHQNPKEYHAWKWSSLPYYVGKCSADWVLPKRILDLFEGQDYNNFLADYDKRKGELDDLKYELANSEEDDAIGSYPNRGKSAI